MLAIDAPWRAPYMPMLRRTVGANTSRSRRAVLVGACAGGMAALAGARVAAADPQQNHSGSAQPFVGFHKLDPVIIHNGKGRLVIEPFVRFRDEHRRTLDGTGPNAFGADAQRLAGLLIRHRLTLLWLDRQVSIGRQEVIETISATINEVTRLDAVESVSFTRFSAR